MGALLAFSAFQFFDWCTAYFSQPPRAQPDLVGPIVFALSLDFGALAFGFSVLCFYRAFKATGGGASPRRNVIYLADRARRAKKR
jgi:hypothetical protein